MDVEIKTLEAQKTMWVHLKTQKEKLGDAFMTSMPKVFGYAHAKATGHVFGRYPAFSDDGVEVQIGIPVSEHLPASDDIVPGEIPGGRYAVTTHVGPYEGLPGTYDALYKWIHENGHRDNGAPFESYIDDPQSTPAESLRTTVSVPIA